MTADSPRTPAEHAEALNESVARIRDHWAFPEDDFDAALAALVALADGYREALRPFVSMVEAFSDFQTVDNGKGLAALSETEWLRLRPRMHEAIVAAAVLAGGAGDE